MIFTLPFELRKQLLICPTRQSVHEYQAIGNCKAAFQSTFKALVLLGAGPAFFISIFAPEVCAWVFGKPWRESQGNSPEYRRPRLS